MHQNPAYQKLIYPRHPLLSALLITYNEEKHIRAFLDEVSFADEIIIVDAYSTDKTVDIARSFLKVRVYQRKFENFPSQKNYALDLATHEWIWFPDADERLDEALKEEILQSISQQNNCHAYFVPIRFHFMGKALLYSGFQNDRSIKLFKKSFCRYDPSTPVHERLLCKGLIGKLKHSLTHYTYTCWDQYDGKLVRYARLQADELFAKGVRPNAFHFFLKPWCRFFNHYIFRRGILDGWEGFFISCLCGFYVFRRYVFLWMKYREIP